MKNLWWLSLFSCVTMNFLWTQKLDDNSVAMNSPSVSAICVLYNRFEVLYTHFKPRSSLENANTNSKLHLIHIQHDASFNLYLQVDTWISGMLRRVFEWSGVINFLPILVQIVYEMGWIYAWMLSFKLIEIYAPHLISVNHLTLSFTHTHAQFFVHICLVFILPATCKYIHTIQHS